MILYFFLSTDNFVFNKSLFGFKPHLLFIFQQSIITLNTLGNDFKDEEEDITSEVSFKTKDNLRKLVKYELEQLSKKSVENNDKEEKYSRVRIDDVISDEEQDENVNTQDGGNQHINDDKLRDIALISTIYGCGLRINEVLSIKYQDIPFNKDKFN